MNYRTKLTRSLAPISFLGAGALGLSVASLYAAKPPVSAPQAPQSFPQSGSPSTSGAADRPTTFALDIPSPDPRGQALERRESADVPAPKAQPFVSKPAPSGTSGAPKTPQSKPALAAAPAGAPPPPVPVQELSEREVQRREALRKKALQDLQSAREAMRLKNYDDAIRYYSAVLEGLPDSRNSVAERQESFNGFRDASLELAQVRITEGRFTPKAGQKYDSAEDVLRKLLERDPQNRRAIRMLEQIYTPGYYNKTFTPAVRAEVEDVKRLLLEAEGYMKLGKYDLAMKRADQILDIDPYNNAARKIQEESNNLITNYAESAYNEARSRAMRNVQKAWASPVKKYGTISSQTTAPQEMQVSQVDKLRRKVASIIIPEVEFKGETLAEVAAKLTTLSREADKSGDPQKGVTILVNIPGSPRSGGGAAPGTSVLDLSAPPAGGAGAGGGGLSDTVSIPKIPNFPLNEILRIVTDQSGTKWTVKENLVEIVPKTVQTETLILRSWTVAPFIFSSSAPKVDDLSSTSGLGALTLGAAAGGAPKAATRSKTDPKEWLSGQNISFAVPGSTATYNQRTKTLTVFNTSEQLELVDQVVADNQDRIPVQVDIQARFVEFSQQNLKELSFDWLMGQANVPGSQNVFVGGGTPGSQRPGLNSSDYPFMIPSNGAYPNGGNPVGVYPVTGGNRSGNLALSSNAIDALLAGASGGSGVAGPAALAIAGAFTDPQFQMVVRALNQSKAIDLLSSPSVVARHGEEASIDIVREFRYPTEFTPPQIPQNVGGAQAGGAGGGAAASAAPQSIPVTPTTPSAFEKRDTGVKLKVTPNIASDNYSVELDLRPEVVEFEGFINYGSPIQTVAVSSALTTGLGSVSSTPKAVTLTENTINQPIFAVRKIQTNVTLVDGETIALGGLIREDVQKVSDKTPVLGDIPLLGRLFRSNVDQHIKKNLTIFVTARIIDAAGQPLKVNKAELEPAEEVPALTQEYPATGR